jgi:hypothetical protein
LLERGTGSRFLASNNMNMDEHITPEGDQEGTASVRRGRGWNISVSLLAVLAGNVLYYLAMPHLPPMWQHRLLTVDLGLGLDFIFCVAVYIVVRAILG